MTKVYFINRLLFPIALIILNIIGSILIFSPILIETFEVEMDGPEAFGSIIILGFYFLLILFNLSICLVCFIYQKRDNIKIYVAVCIFSLLNFFVPQFLTASFLLDSWYHRKAANSISAKDIDTIVNLYSNINVDLFIKIEGNEVFYNISGLIIKETTDNYEIIKYPLGFQKSDFKILQHNNIDSLISLLPVQNRFYVSGTKLQDLVTLIRKSDYNGIAKMDEHGVFLFYMYDYFYGVRGLLSVQNKVTFSDLKTTYPKTKIVGLNVNRIFYLNNNCFYLSLNGSTNY